MKNTHLLIALASLLATAPSFAGEPYPIPEDPDLRCPATVQVFQVREFAGGHGLWMPGLNGPNNRVKLRFRDDATLTVFAEGHAELRGTAYVYDLDGGPGVLDEEWHVDFFLQYRGRGDEHGGPKIELARHQPPEVVAHWDYFNLIEGSLSRPGSEVTLSQRPLDGRYPWQQGQAANGKTNTYGAAMWFYFQRVDEDGPGSEGHGDINVDLLAQPLEPDCGALSGRLFCPGEDGDLSYEAVRIAWTGPDCDGDGEADAGEVRTSAMGSWRIGELCAGAYTVFAPGGEFDPVRIALADHQKRSVAIDVAFPSNERRWRLHDHPNGSARPPLYGLRYDGLFAGELGATGGTTTFSFDHPEAGVWAVLDREAATLRIHGVMYGGEDAGEGFGYGEGRYAVDFTYDAHLVAMPTGWIVEVEGEGEENSGTITSLDDPDQSWVVYDFGPGHETFLLQADGHRMRGDATVGRGWLSGDVERRDPGRRGFQDFLFVAEPLPDPCPCGEDDCGGEPPVCRAEVVKVHLDPSCRWQIDAEDVDAGSEDPDGGELMLSIDRDRGRGTEHARVELTVTDDEGEQAVCAAGILPIDVTPPRVKCRSERPVYECVRGCGDGVEVRGVAADACDGNLPAEHRRPNVWNPGELGHLGECYPVGRTPVRFRAEDHSGNVGICDVDVRVVDSQPPEVMCSMGDLMLGALQRVLVVRMGSSDVCDGRARTQAFLQCGDLRVPTFAGDVVGFLHRAEGPCEMQEMDNGARKFIGPNISLKVDAMDRAGNVSHCRAEPPPPMRF